MFATTVTMLLLAPLLLVNTVFVLELLFGLHAVAFRDDISAHGRATIVVPAHDEEAGLGHMLAALRSETEGSFDILVIADNCSDQTAAVARAAGVRVAERSDPLLRGKGHALAFARDLLRTDPPESVVILDADCSTSRRSLHALAAVSAAQGKAAQAVNLLEPAPSAGPLVQVSSFAFLIKNLVRQRGLQRLAGKVHLTGTGMCLPWRLFEKADLATSSIVEDLKLGLELARAGKPPLLVEEARVWSPHADQSQTLGQRSRWEGGFLSLARTAGPAMIGRGLTSLSSGTLFAGLDLLVPPLALLVVLDVLALGGAVLLAVAGVTSWLPVLLLGSLGSLAAAGLLLAWWLEGRAFLSPSALLRLPLYPLWKLPMYLRLARSGAPSSWNRTARPGETGDTGAP